MCVEGAAPERIARPQSTQMWRERELGSSSGTGVAGCGCPQMALGQGGLNWGETSSGFKVPVRSLTEGNRAAAGERAHCHPGRAVPKSEGIYFNAVPAELGAELRLLNLPGERQRQRPKRAPHSPRLEKSSSLPTFDPVLLGKGSGIWLHGKFLSLWPIMLSSLLETSPPPPRPCRPIALLL